jgi:ribosomal protein L36
MTLLSIVHDIIDFAQVDMHYKYLYKRKYTKKIYKINKKNDKHKQKQKRKNIYKQNKIHEVTINLPY